MAAELEQEIGDPISIEEGQPYSGEFSPPFFTAEEYRYVDPNSRVAFGQIALSASVAVTFGLK
jgi:hypothetical protein